MISLTAQFFSCTLLFVFQLGLLLFQLYNDVRMDFISMKHRPVFNSLYYIVIIVELVAVCFGLHGETSCLLGYTISQCVMVPVYLSYIIWVLVSLGFYIYAVLILGGLLLIFVTLMISTSVLSCREYQRVKKQETAVPTEDNIEENSMGVELENIGLNTNENVHPVDKEEISDDQ